MQNKLEPTFSEIVKEEICHIEYKDKEAKCILLSFLINNAKKEKIKNTLYYSITTYFLINVWLIKKLIKQLNLNWKISIFHSENNKSNFKTKYLILIKNIDEIEQYFNNFNYEINKFTKSEQACFVAGAFLSSGSISFSKNKSNYHFEIRSCNYDYLNNINDILSKRHIKANLINYRNQFKLYIKKSELISDILKLLKTDDALYEYEDFRIKRDFSNSLQRVNNLDISNINKTIIASKQQILWIQTIKNKHLFDQLDERTKIFCELRLEHRESNLEEISKLYLKKYDLTVPRTSLSHVINKLKKIYLEIKSKE